MRLNPTETYLHPVIDGYCFRSFLVHLLDELVRLSLEKTIISLISNLPLYSERLIYSVYQPRDHHHCLEQSLTVLKGTWKFLTYNEMLFTKIQIVA